MTGSSESRFVSKGVDGLTFLSGNGRRQPLLEGRSAGLDSQGGVDRAVTKNRLIHAVSASTSISRADTCKVFDSVLQEIAAALKNRQDVHIEGFGTFTMVVDRDGRDPPQKSRHRRFPKSEEHLAFEPEGSLRDAVK